MDWGDPAYLDEVADVPGLLKAGGVKIAKLVLLGVSYSGFANAQLIATHPEIRPTALIVVDSYLDLPARYRALPLGHEMRAQLERAMVGMLAERPSDTRCAPPAPTSQASRGRSAAVCDSSMSGARARPRSGSSYAATRGRLANAYWLSRLATVLRGPVTGYVTSLPHAHALWDRGQGLLQLAGVRPASRPLRARTVTFAPGASRPPPGQLLLNRIDRHRAGSLAGHGRLIWVASTVGP